MFGVFKKLFSKAEPPPPPVASDPPSPAPPPAASVAAPAASQAPAVTAPGPIVAGDSIQLSLRDIIARLPVTMSALVIGPAEGTFSLPLNSAAEQLRTGAVRVPFSQLRIGAPPGVFANNPTFDEALIDLPLASILAAIGPAALARRNNQTRLDAPESVTSVFTLKGGFAIVPKASAHAAAASSAPAAVPAPVIPAPKIPGLTIPAPTIPAPTIPAPALVPPVPAAPIQPPVAPISLPLTPPTAAPAQTVSGTVTVLVNALSSGWPENVRQEIEAHHLSDATIAIPVASLEAVMKSGRVTFSWDELRRWMTPAPPSSAHGGATLELPLRVIAPLFIGARQPSTAPKKLAVSENVPEVFLGVPRRGTQPAPAAAPPTPSAAGAQPPVAAPTTEPPRHDLAPAQVVHEIVSQPGVAGCIIGTADGLLIAGELPSPWKAETVAGFLPQIFSRASGYCDEAQMGTLGTLTLQAGQMRWAIIKAGPLFLAAASKPAEPLPEAILQRIAGELTNPNRKP